MPTETGVVVALQVGFFPEESGEAFAGRRFLKQLSALTGGTFQVTQWPQLVHRSFWQASI
jgi:hypothetical protein